MQTPKQPIRIVGATLSLGTPISGLDFSEEYKQKHAMSNIVDEKKQEHSEPTHEAEEESELLFYMEPELSFDTDLPRNTRINSSL